MTGERDVTSAGIRHPEELSLARQLDSEELKRNQGVSAVRRTQIPGMTSSPNGLAPANNSYDSGTMSSPYRTTLTPQVTCFLLRDAMPARQMLSLCVCPSVRPSVASPVFYQDG